MSKMHLENITLKYKGFSLKVNHPHPYMCVLMIDANLKSEKKKKKKKNRSYCNEDAIRPEHFDIYFYRTKYRKCFDIFILLFSFCAFDNFFRFLYLILLNSHLQILTIFYFTSPNHFFFFHLFSFVYRLILIVFYLFFFFLFLSFQGSVTS